MISASEVPAASFPLLLVRRGGQSVCLLQDEQGLALLPFDVPTAERQVIRHADEVEGLTLAPLSWSLEARLRVSLHPSCTRTWLLLFHAESKRHYQLPFDTLVGAPRAILEGLDWNVQGHMEIYLVSDVAEEVWPAEGCGSHVRLADEEETLHERLLVADSFKELAAHLTEIVDALLAALAEKQTLPCTAVVHPQGLACPVNIHCWDDALRRQEHAWLLLRRGGLLHAAQRVRSFPVAAQLQPARGAELSATPAKPRWHAHLVSNIHQEAKPPNPSIDGAHMHLVSGTYDYYHYRVDGFKDDGWGCAYRSLQTVLSWFIHQGYLSAEVPSHRQIQQILSAVDPDKVDKKSFVGSKEWIGSFEIMLVLQHYLPGLDCLIRRMESGAALDEDPSVQSLLLEHFRQPDAPPVMIGGSSYAHTILGVYMNPLTMEAQYLVLDPHYASDTTVVKKAVSSGYIGWKKAASFFEKKSWYNMCIPQVGSYDPR